MTSTASGADVTTAPSSEAVAPPRPRFAAGRPWLWACAVAVASLATGLLCLWVATWIVHQPFDAVANRFDTSWYWKIAQSGYPHRVATGPTDYTGLRSAFFPGLPLAERIVHDVLGGPAPLTTCLVGGIGFVAACVAVRALARRDEGDGIAGAAVALFAFFPGAYVFVMGYSEALAIPLAAACLYWLHRRRFVLAGLAAGLAGTVRLSASVLVAACAVAALGAVLGREERLGLRALAAPLAAPVLAATGLVAWLLVLRARTGDALAFDKAERLGWQDRFTLLTPFHDLRAFAAHPFHVPLDTMNALGVVVVVVVCVVLAVVRLPVADKVYGIGILLLWLFTTNAGAFPRYLEMAFPVLVVAGRRLPPAAVAPVTGVLGAGLAVLVLLFATSNPFFP